MAHHFISFHIRQSLFCCKVYSSFKLSNVWTIFDFRNFETDCRRDRATRSSIDDSHCKWICDLKQSWLHFKTRPSVKETKERGKKCNCFFGQANDPTRRVHRVHFGTRVCKPRRTWLRDRENKPRNSCFDRTNRIERSVRPRLVQGRGK